MLSGGMVLKSYELTKRNGEGREKEGKSLDPQFNQKLGESSLTAFASSASPPESLLYHDSMVLWRTYRADACHPGWAVCQSFAGGLAIPSACSRILFCLVDRDPLVTFIEPVYR